MEKHPQPQGESSGELQRLRDRSGQEELSGELKRSLFGGVSLGDVQAYVDKLRTQWHSAEQTYKGYIADLSREKETLRQERDALEGRLTEQMAALRRAQEAADLMNHPQVLQLYEQTRQTQDQLDVARRVAETAQTRAEELEMQLRCLLEDSRTQELRLQAIAQQKNDAPSPEEYEQRCARYEEKIVQLNTRLSDQLYELSEASARVEALSREAEQRETTLRQQAQAQQEQLQQALEALRQQGQGTQGDIARLEQQLDEAHLAKERSLHRLAEAQSDAEAARAQLREQASVNQALREQTRAEARQRMAEEERARRLEAENRALSNRLEDVADAIQEQVRQIDDTRALNARLKESMSSLLVKAEALVRENEMLSGQLHGERERVAQVQAIHERLVDMLTRLRMAHQLLGERMADVDRAVGYGMPRGMGQPPPAAGSRRAAMEPLNLDGGGSSALYDMMQELNNIQATLSQIQTIPVQEEVKPNIRYSVEKLEVDCPGKKENEPDTFRLSGEYGTRNRVNRE